VPAVCQHPGSISVWWMISSDPSDSREWLISDRRPSSSWHRTRQCARPSVTSRTVHHSSSARCPVYTKVSWCLGTDRMDSVSPLSSGSKYSSGDNSTTRGFASLRRW
jgi:hypothetical protein